MREYTDFENFENTDELRALVNSKTYETILKSILNMNKLDNITGLEVSELFSKSIDNLLYNNYLSNDWVNRKKHDIKIRYYKKIFWEMDEDNVKKPTKLKKILSPGIKFEEDMV